MHILQGVNVSAHVFMRGYGTYSVESLMVVVSVNFFYKLWRIGGQDIQNEYISASGWFVTSSGDRNFAVEDVEDSILCGYVTSMRAGEGVIVNFLKSSVVVYCMHIIKTHENTHLQLKN